MGWNQLKLTTVTLDPEDSALDAGDVAIEITEIPNVLRDRGQCATLRSLMLIDPADQGAALDLYFFRTAVTFGTLDAAPSISDADCLEFLGKVVVATGDYADLGGARVAHKTALDFILKGGDNSASIFVAATCVGTPTYGASLLTLKLGVEY